jgi:2-oxopent-4-enoate/cis-2-oxohex-4-enoate hydratase
MALDRTRIEVLGDELFMALRERAPVSPITEREPGITIEDPYQVQLQMTRLRLGLGEKVVGKKIGVTSKAVQDMLKVDQPDFGHLTSGMIYNDGDVVSIENFIQPRAEGEIAFLLSQDLDGPGVTNADVLRATECVMACFEIVDSRRVRQRCLS